MPTERMRGAIRRLQESWLATDLADGELLERFLVRRDDAAFAALVRRHGPMVLAVCRRILGDVHDAEDAFQATFLVLLRKAHVIKPPGRVGAWLHGVAYRTSLKAQTMNRRRRGKQRPLTEVAAPTPAETEWLALLDREIQRLPAKYRLPIVLCDLEGKTRKQAARETGWPEGTVATRLQHGRSLVQKRLARHGLPASVAVTLAWGEWLSAASVPAPLLADTLKTASLFQAGKAAGFVSLKVLALAQGVVKAMILGKIKNASGALLVTSLLAVGLGGLAGVGTSTASEDYSQQTAPAPGKPARFQAAEDPFYPAQVVEPATADPSQPRLPVGPAPVQALVSMDKGNVLVQTYEPVSRPRQITDNRGQRQTVFEIVYASPTRHYKPQDVEVYDIRRRKLDNKTLPQLLQKEIVALLLVGSREIDPLHLRLIKEDTLIFVVPALTGPPPVGMTALSALADGSPGPTSIAIPADARTSPWANKLFGNALDHDFGIVPRGTTLKHSFTMTNLYAIPLQITDIRLNCGCITVSPSSKILRPKETVLLHCNLDTTRLSGPKTITVFVTVGSEYVSTATLTLTLDVREGSGTNPASINSNGGVNGPLTSEPPRTPIVQPAPAPASALPTPQMRIDQAEKEMTIAEFYLKTGHQASAEFYYDLIRRRYAGTPYAKQADHLLKELHRADQAAPPKASKARVGQIIIVGNTRIPDTVLLEEIPLHPGQLLNDADVRAAEERLRSLKSLVNASPIVNIRPTVTVLDTPADSNYKDILITVRESLRLDMLEELKRLEGLWIMSAASLDGKELDPLVGTQFIFAGDRLTIQGKQPPGRSTVTIEPAANPKTIRLTALEGPSSGRTMVGNYELAGDTLTISLGEEEPRARDHRQVGRMKVTLRRDKKEKIERSVDRD